jgi:AraC-like DNA-binding protein
VLDRLLDVLLMLAIRSDFRRSPAAPRWYRASADPRLGAALQAMHENAGHPWSVPELAAISGLSRAAFARTFRDALGQTPMHYLTDWRMALARDYLRTGQLSMTAIARSVGYSSPYAFAAAFTRHHGQPPGTWRQREPLRVQARPGDDPTPPDSRPALRAAAESRCAAPGRRSGGLPRGAPGKDAVEHDAGQAAALRAAVLARPDTPQVTHEQ